VTVFCIPLQKAAWLPCPPYLGNLIIVIIIHIIIIAITKICLYRVMKSQRQRADIAVPTLNDGATWVLVYIVRPLCFISKKVPWYPLQRELGDAQDPTAEVQKREKCLPPTWVEPQAVPPAETNGRINNEFENCG
jgi:hypothetical protein